MRTLLELGVGLRQGLTHHTVPAFGDDTTHVLGSIIFNYAYITIIPSWINEKRPDVSVTKTVRPGSARVAITCCPVSRAPATPVTRRSEPVLSSTPCMLPGSHLRVLGAASRSPNPSA